MKNSQKSVHESRQEEKTAKGRKKRLFLSVFIVLCLSIGGGIFFTAQWPGRRNEAKERLSSEDPLSQTKAEEEAKKQEKEQTRYVKASDSENEASTADAESSLKKESFDKTENREKGESSQKSSRDEASESSVKDPTETTTEESKDAFLDTASKEVLPLDLHVHQYRQETVAPGCTTEGYTRYTCACGDSYTGEKRLPLGHSFSEWETILWPSYRQEGLKERVCARCGQIEQERIERLVPYLLTEADKQQIYDMVQALGESYGFACLGVGSSESYGAPSGTFESWRGREYTIQTLVSGAEGDFYMMKQEGGRSGFMMLIVGDGSGSGTSNGCDYEIYIYQV